MKPLLIAALALCACKPAPSGTHADPDGAPEPQETPAADAARPEAAAPPRDADPKPPADGALVIPADATTPSADGPASPPPEVIAPKTVVLGGAKLAANKRRILEGDPALKATLALLVASADKALVAGPWSVMNKTTTPPSGNKHDYSSLARYWWPSASANGCPYVRKDGQTNPDTTTSKYDHASRHAAMDALYTLAMAWYFTGDARYAQRAALVARTWFLDPATAMNPNVNFGEGIPCLRNGSDTGVLNWTELIGQTLDALAVLETGAPGWSAADQTAMRAWMTALLGWLQTSTLGKGEGRAVNNHGTWYDAGVASLMVYLGQTAAAEALIKGSGVKRIDTQIAADGRQPEEMARTNTWGYANWNLEGFCLLAHTASHTGVDLWAHAAPGGGTLAKAVDFLIDGAVRGKAGWPHPQILPIEQSWAVPLLHAAAELANDAAARAALEKVPPPAGGDLWPLLPVCTAPAIQPD
jgi:hypothetical protein